MGMLSVEGGGIPSESIDVGSEGGEAVDIDVLESKFKATIGLWYGDNKEEVRRKFEKFRE